MFLSSNRDEIIVSLIKRLCFIVDSSMGFGNSFDNSCYCNNLISFLMAVISF